MTRNSDDPISAHCDVVFKVTAKTLQNSLPLCFCLQLAGGTLVTPAYVTFFIFPTFDFQLDPFYASIILFVGRAWDAVTDPTVGFLVSRSPWTRVGRMLPWYVRLDSTSLFHLFIYIFLSLSAAGNCWDGMFFQTALLVSLTC